MKEELNKKTGGNLEISISVSNSGNPSCLSLISIQIYSNYQRFCFFYPQFPRLSQNHF